MLGMVCVSIFFATFFTLPWAPEWIRNNIHLVPQGQIIAYSLYLGVYLATKTGNLLEQKPRDRVNKAKVLFVSAEAFNKFTVATIDLITITVIAFSFFVVGYGSGGEQGQHAIFLSDIASFFAFPLLSLFVYFCLRKVNRNNHG